MNVSAILINLALRAAERAQSRDVYSPHHIYTAIVFAAMAIEALLNEQAFIRIKERGIGSLRVYEAVEKGAQGFERIQAILTYLFQESLEDGQNPANDFKLLLQIRNGLVHYRFERPPTKALDQLSQYGRFGKGWKNASIAWPTYVTPELAIWAYETACHTAAEIAEILNHAGESLESDLIKTNFDADEIRRLLAE
jgi:hypothetical protein